MNDKILVHSALTYECEKCGKRWRMYLECGVGTCGCSSTCRFKGKCDVAKGKMPCPFMIGCTCGGTAKHIDWHKDTKFPHPLPVFDHMSYFKFDREGLKNNDPRACGIPVVNPNSLDLRKGE